MCDSTIICGGCGKAVACDDAGPRKSPQREVKPATFFGGYLVQQNVVSEAQVLEALEAQYEYQEPLGKIALRYRTLTLKQVMEVLNRQADTRKPFGEIAIDAGYMDTMELSKLMSHQLVSRPPLGEMLTELGYLTYEELEMHLAAFAATKKKGQRAA